MLPPVHATDMKRHSFKTQSTVAYASPEPVLVASSCHFHIEKKTTQAEEGFFSLVFTPVLQRAHRHPGATIRATAAPAARETSHKTNTGQHFVGNVSLFLVSVPST